MPCGEFRITGTNEINNAVAMQHRATVIPIWKRKSISTIPLLAATMMERPKAPPT